jgi:signal transduction histidine kinase
MAGEQNEPPPETPAIVHRGRRVVPYIAISVRDTGIGIAPEHLPLVFEEFRQVHDPRGKQRGSGLGLSICRHIVEAHGGNIWVESTLGQGSIFTFTIPCYLETQRSPTTLNARAERIHSREVPTLQSEQLIDTNLIDTNAEADSVG